MVPRGSKGYRYFFPLDPSPPSAPVPAQGAYQWLDHKGYGSKVKNIKRQFRSGHSTQVTTPRRAMVSGLLDKYGLVNQFLDQCWTDKHNPSRHERRDKMNLWINEYRHRYARQYGDLIK